MKEIIEIFESIGKKIGKNDLIDIKDLEILMVDHGFKILPSIPDKNGHVSKLFVHESGIFCSEPTSGRLYIDFFIKRDDFSLEDNEIKVNGRLQPFSKLRIPIFLDDSHIQFSTVYREIKRNFDLISKNHNKTSLFRLEEIERTMLNDSLFAVGSSTTLNILANKENDDFFADYEELKQMFEYFTNSDNSTHKTTKALSLKSLYKEFRPILDSGVSEDVRKSISRLIDENIVAGNPNIILSSEIVPEINFHLGWFFVAYSSQFSQHKKSENFIKFVKGLSANDSKKILAATSPSGHNFLTRAIADLETKESEQTYQNVIDCLISLTQKFKKDHKEIFDQYNLSPFGIIAKALEDNKSNPEFESEILKSSCVILIHKLYKKGYPISFNSLDGFVFLDGKRVPSNNENMDNVMSIIKDKNPNFYAEITEKKLNSAWSEILVTNTKSSNGPRF